MYHLFFLHHRFRKGALKGDLYAEQEYPDHILYSLRCWNDAIFLHSEAK